MTYKVLAYKIVYDSGIAKYYIVNNNIGLDVNITQFNSAVKNKMIKCQFNPNSCFYIRNTEGYTAQDMLRFINNDKAIYKRADIINISIKDFIELVSYPVANTIISKNFDL